MMNADPVLLEELRLLRAMGEGGRTAAAKALRSARLGLPENPGDAATGAAASTETGEDPMKLMTRRLDAAIVQGGGTSIYACKPRGDLSTRAAKRLARWTFETPTRHADATGRKPKVGPERRRVLPGQPLPPLPEGKR